MGARVLVIDDDPKLRAMVSDYLRENGYVVVSSEDGERGLAELRRSEFDLVLLDVMMPGIDGLETLKRIRAGHDRVAVMMLTAKGDETDRVVGLELGADDYLAKPFGPRELLARTRALLRRAVPSLSKERMSFGALTIEPETRTVELGGEAVELTGFEFELLVALAERAGRVVSRESLLESAGRSDMNVGDRTVDVHISHLRQKLGASRIRTVRGVGYIFSKGDGE